MIVPPSGISGRALCAVKQQALDVGADDAVDVLLSDRAERDPLNDGGIGEDDVDASLFPADLPVDPVEVPGLGDVPLDGGDAGSGGRRRSVQFRLAAAGDVDLGALPGELSGGGQADAGAAARDEGDLAVQLPGHDVPPSSLSWPVPSDVPC
jgi:hypothetical protein